MRDGQKTRFARQLRKAMTPAEVLIWSRIRRDALGYRFHRQKPLGPYVLDFCCFETMLSVEIDGATHSTPGERSYDANRSCFIESEGWRELRVWNSEVFANLDGVLRAIGRACWEQEQQLKQRRASP